MARCRRGVGGGRTVELPEGEFNVDGLAVTAVDENGAPCTGTVNLLALPPHCSTRENTVSQSLLDPSDPGNSVFFEFNITCTTEDPISTLPGSPRSVALRVVESSGGIDIVVSWSPPESDGGSAITGYAVTLLRSRGTFGPYEVSASARSHTLPGVRADTTYTVQVVAINAHGSSSPASETVTTPPPPGGLPGPPRDVALRVIELSIGLMSSCRGRRR